VIVPYQVSCGACAACADRRYGGCRTYRGQVGAAFGFGPAGGGHGGGISDLLPVPAADHLLVPAPDGIAPQVLCTLSDNGVDGYRTVAPQRAAAAHSDVLVVGGAASSVGLYAVAAAVALGFRGVRYIDRDQAQCEAAARLGADAQLQAGPWPRSFPRAAVTVENTMETDGLACTLRSTDDYGYCTSVAIHFAELTPLPLLHMYTKGITLHLSRADSRRYLPAALDLVTSGRLDPSAVPTTVVSWDDAADAWLQPAVKLVVSRNGLN
jgi:threonine dehydrogenase-like Zn-dependent dehydrogenase